MPNRNLIVIISTFLIFLLGLPEIIALRYPCLKPTPLQSFTYTNCNSTSILNSFLLFGLAALAPTIIFLAKITPTFNQFLTTSVICSLLLIGAFYAHLSFLETRINQAPIILEPSSF